MKLDAIIAPGSLREVLPLVEAAERIGFDGLWTSETQHHPFLPLALVAAHSRSIEFGTAVAIGFARSPTTLAHTAWDLAAASRGRFLLGLGTQVRPHIERRFGMPWPDSPVEKLRELIAAIRALWSAWQTGEKLNFRGQYYKLTLMSPFFNPGSIEHPNIPIYIAGVNTGLCRLAGEAADGFHVHPLHSREYLGEVIRPAIEEGARRTERQAGDVAVTVTPFVVLDPASDAYVRSQIAFYASTPSYRGVFELHGWSEIARRLSELARRQAWQEMAALIDDDILAAFAVSATPDDLGRELRARYTGLAERVAVYLPFRAGERDDFWTQVVQGFRSGG